LGLVISIQGTLAAGESLRLLTPLTPELETLQPKTVKLVSGGEELRLRPCERLAAR
jgi:hypothetical protein